MEAAVLRSVSWSEYIDQTQKFALSDRTLGSVLAKGHQGLLLQQRLASGLSKGGNGTEHSSVQLQIWSRFGAERHWRTRRCPPRSKGKLRLFTGPPSEAHALHPGPRLPGRSRGRPGIGRAAHSAPPGRRRCSVSSPAGPAKSAPPQLCPRGDKNTTCALVLHPSPGLTKGLAQFLDSAKARGHSCQRHLLFEQLATTVHFGKPLMLSRRSLCPSMYRSCSAFEALGEQLILQH